MHTVQSLSNYEIKYCNYVPVMFVPLVSGNRVLLKRTGMISVSCTYYKGLV